MGLGGKSKHIFFMDHSRNMLRFRDMLPFLNPPTQHKALLRARSARNNSYFLHTLRKQIRFLKIIHFHSVRTYLSLFIHVV